MIFGWGFLRFRAGFLEVFIRFKKHSLMALISKKAIKAGGKVDQKIRK